MQYVDGRDHRYHGVHDELPVVQYSIPARRTLVLYPCASPVVHATLVKVLTCPRYDQTSPVVIDNIETIAARGGSLFMLKFFRALVAVIPAIGSLPTPRRTRDADKNKQRREFHSYSYSKAHLSDIIWIPVIRRSLQWISKMGSENVPEARESNGNRAGEMQVSTSVDLLSPRRGGRKSPPTLHQFNFLEATRKYEKGRLKLGSLGLSRVNEQNL